MSTNQQLERVAQSVTKMEEVMQKYSGFGASDTEPDWQFQNLLARVVQGKEYKIPQGEEWELYTATMSCKRAANALTSQAARVVKAVEAVAVKNYPELKEYATDVCWRTM